MEFDSAGTRTYRATEIYPNGEEITSEPISFSWVSRSISLGFSTADPSPGDRVMIAATVVNPHEGDPTYPWEREMSSGWQVQTPTERIMWVTFDSAGARTWRVTAIYPNGGEVISDPFSLTW